MEAEGDEVAKLLVLVRRVVAARVENAHDRDDLVQETMARTIAARDRVAETALPAYAVTVARNLTAAHHARRDLDRRHLPRLLDLREPARPADTVVALEDEAALRAAVAMLPGTERDALVGHVLDGLDTAALAAMSEGTPGGIAARLARARARARVDYVLALRRQQLPSPGCRPVLLAVSAADRRRQEALGAAQHLLACPVCPGLLPPLTERRSLLAGILPLPFLVALARLRAQPRATQAAAAGAAVAVVVAGAAVTVEVVSRPPRAGVTGAAGTAARPPRAGVTAAAGTAAAVAAPSAHAASTPPAASATGGPSVPARVAEPAAAGTSPATAGTVVPIGPIVKGVVDDVAAPFGFWLATATGRVYVHFSGLPPRQVRLGDRTSVQGTVTPMTEAFLADPAAAEPSERAQLRAAGSYLEAAGKTIRLSARHLSARRLSAHGAAAPAGRDGDAAP